ncbi:GNAT family N-acetyltransferase [Dactylosporangium sp. AC04546]|uniref:GNAT family N-acetyltransferase n=1 Tax=Dactylosporangium sp. AC04546 TaxID=2862460 RepID=UPI001EE0B4ED|nr:GNAT family N-acetyltransferase [Dactylosporangium sp. AC04546]WVK80241.1 GNAT family N-acetyltransferase [Dactylosporangium sp. AC04546]
MELRHWVEDDLEAFFDIYSRWEVMRWLGPQPRRALADVDEARERLARWHARERDLAAPYGLWAIVPAGSAVPVGTVLLLPLHDQDGLTDEVEIGWHLHPDHQGRGLVTEAARRLLRDAPAGVLALTDPDNDRSQAVARRLGMRDEGLTDRWFGLTARQFRLPGSTS